MVEDGENRPEDHRPTTKLNRIARRWKGPRQYSDEEIGTALAVLDHYSGNALRASRELGIPRTTIIRWTENQERLSPAAVSVRQRKREEFAQLSEEAAEWIITSITPKDIRGASLYQKATSYGIFRDKANLDRGQPTQIVEHRHVKQAYLVLVERHSREPGEAIEILSEELQLPLDEVKRLCE
jgi:hypothetical protein